MLFVPLVIVSIMQPYFFPYRGYFRLIEESDIFVIYDCVQFPRRGWVHRNTPTHGGPWLTVPLSKCDLDTRIKDVLLSEDYEESMSNRINKFPQIVKSLEENIPLRGALLHRKDRNLLSLLVDTLQLSCDFLGINFDYCFSSQLGINDEIKGENRIISISKEMGATEYINAPSGKSLYSDENFNKEGIKLRFLEDWTGPLDSIITSIIE